MELALQLLVLGPQGPPVLLQSLVLAPPLFTLLLSQSQGPLREIKEEGGASGVSQRPPGLSRALHGTPTPACSAVAALRSFSPPALSAVTPWPSVHSCFSDLPSPLAPFSFPKGNISVNSMQFNKHTLRCMPNPELGYRNEKNLVLARRAETPVIWWSFVSSWRWAGRVPQVK